MMVEFIITKKKKSEQTILRVYVFFFFLVNIFWATKNSVCSILLHSSVNHRAHLGFWKKNTHLGQMWNLASNEIVSSKTYFSESLGIFATVKSMNIEMTTCSALILNQVYMCTSQGSTIFNVSGVTKAKKNNFYKVVKRSKSFSWVISSHIAALYANFYR
jgi:hypothetical protein